MSETVTRLVRPADLDVLWRLNQAEVPAVGTTTRDQFGWLVDVSSHTLVVDAGTELAAFIVLLGPGADYGSPNYRYFSERFERFLYVDRIVVAPDHQRQGHGARLYDEAVTLAVAGGAQVLTAEVNVRPRNETSLAFHASYGFQSVGEQDTDGGDKRVTMLALDIEAGATPRS